MNWTVEKPVKRHRGVIQIHQVVDAGSTAGFKHWRFKAKSNVKYCILITGF